MVRCTFSPTRAWRLAVGPASTRTLGIRKSAVQCASRKCACRRELNSHDTRPSHECPHRTVARGVGVQSTHMNQQPDFSQGRRERRPVQTHEDAARSGDRTLQCISGSPVSNRKSEGEGQRGSASWPHATEKATSSKAWSALQGAERHAKSFAGAADAEYRDCSCRGAEQAAESFA